MNTVIDVGDTIYIPAKVGTMTITGRDKRVLCRMSSEYISGYIEIEEQEILRKCIRQTTGSEENTLEKAFATAHECCGERCVD